ncbi:hypothetical protein EY04_27455 [Pseudomonas chlororaphis]|uniref:hypothetical protein n=1 Tax=Pseudomonas chlororaphis TaxID=587753 RepID=UPI0004AC07EF|nr:hypothetical protein [Pseudomonas chlororaphis]AIC22521.1 hypothetical protein EY04_27455 [Pseudomonas chlororaphis]
MHTEAHFVLEDVLMTCRTLTNFGDRAIKNLEHGIPNDLDDEEKDELERAFNLMRLILNCVNPLISASFDKTTQRRVG